MRRAGHVLVIGGLCMRKSSRSQVNNCVRVGEKVLDGQTTVVYDNLPDDAARLSPRVLCFSADAHTAFISAVKAGGLNA